MKPLRMCTVCRKRQEKADLIRVVRVNNTIMIDKDGKLQGRGAYICKDSECIKVAQKRRALERAFSGKVDENIYSELICLTEGEDEF